MQKPTAKLLSIPHSYAVLGQTARCSAALVPNNVCCTFAMSLTTLLVSASSWQAVPNNKQKLMTFIESGRHIQHTKP